MIKLNFKKALLALALSAISSSALANAWDDYKAKYLQADGAIVDTYNHNKSHSEGQSYGLMFSCFYDDKDSFDKILNWTDSNLKDLVFIHGHMSVKAIKLALLIKIMPPMAI